MKFAVVILGIALAGAGLPAQAQAYKCVSGDKTVYSDTPCAGSSSKTVETRGAAAPAGASGGTPRVLGEQSCKTAIAKQIRWNDPDSVRIGNAIGGEMEVTEVADTRMGARRYSVNVNAKNPYGVYFGEKAVVCFTSQDGNRVLRLDSTAIDKSTYN